MMIGFDSIITSRFENEEDRKILQIKDIRRQME